MTSSPRDGWRIPAPSTEGAGRSGATDRDTARDLLAVLLAALAIAMGGYVVDHLLTFGLGGATIGGWDTSVLLYFVVLPGGLVWALARTRERSAPLVLSLVWTAFAFIAALLVTLAVYWVRTCGTAVTIHQLTADLQVRGGASFAQAYAAMLQPDDVRLLLLLTYTTTALLATLIAFALVVRAGWRSYAAGRRASGAPVAWGPGAIAWVGATSPPPTTPAPFTPPPAAAGMPVTRSARRWRAGRWTTVRGGLVALLALCAVLMAAYELDIIVRTRYPIGRGWTHEALFFLAFVLIPLGLAHGVRARSHLAALGAMFWAAGAFAVSLLVLVLVLVENPARTLPPFVDEVYTAVDRISFSTIGQNLPHPDLARRLAMTGYTAATLIAAVLSMIAFAREEVEPADRATTAPGTSIGWQTPPMAIVPPGRPPAASAEDLGESHAGAEEAGPGRGERLPTQPDASAPGPERE